MLPLEIHPTHTPDPTEASCEGSHEFHQRDEEPSGQFEVFWMDADIDDDGNGINAGWYWSDSFAADPRGPFITSRDAFVDAQWSAQ